MGYFRQKEDAVDELRDGSPDGLLADGARPEFSRRDFLKKAAGVVLAAPAAGALVGSAAAAPRIRVGNAAQPYAGVTLQFAKAPFGNDETDEMSKLLAQFEKKTGIKVVHTIVPWTAE